MNIDKIMNLQYRKVLTEKDRIYDYIKDSNSIKELSNIEILSIFIVDVDDLDKEILDINELKQAIIDENLSKILSLKNKRLSDDINKRVVLEFVEFLNKNRVVKIGYELLDAIL